MHSELCMMSDETAQILNATKKQGGRVICVGTTSCRTLESLVNEDGTFEAKSKWTDIFIYPGYHFKAMDAQARENGVSIADHDLPESRYLGLCVAKASAALCAQANPLTYAGARMARLLVQHGTADRLVPYQQSVALVEGLKQKGLGGRVTFTTLEGADHDDARFYTAENLEIVFDFIERTVEEAD